MHLALQLIYTDCIKIIRNNNNNNNRSKKVNTRIQTGQQQKQQWQKNSKQTNNNNRIDVFRIIGPGISSPGVLKQIQQL